MDAYDREAERIEQDLLDGRITDEEYRREMRYLEESRRAEAEEAARDVMESYGYYDDPHW
jgi:hypothetical protein